MIQEFKDFIAKGNVMDLAVGIIIGAAFTAIVTSLVSDLINPVIGLVLGGVDFTSMYVVLSGDVPAGHLRTPPLGLHVLLTHQVVTRRHLMLISLLSLVKFSIKGALGRLWLPGGFCDASHKVHVPMHVSKECPDGVRLDHVAVGSPYQIDPSKCF